MNEEFGSRRAFTIRQNETILSLLGKAGLRPLRVAVGW